MLEQDLKPELQRRVIDVRNTGQYMAQVNEAVEAFGSANRDTRYKRTAVLGESDTFLLPTLDARDELGIELDKREVPYSLHPARDYEKIAGQDMSEGAKANLSLLGRGS